MIDPLRIAALLADGDVDAAIDAGLMDYVDDGRHPPEAAVRAVLLDAQRRLRTAWEARERYRARNARLARRMAEREARRRAATATPVATTTPALPPAAAAALARAKARVTKA